ncbi:probable microtubule-binding protein TANGLED [Trifolium pratense]|uniref:probable microtubule-binding protein TANGLED n=1 Tax=Trifolium pratense TaxID=57577 RepID=UPI001E693AA8|nr:probable microtubule-binding protein TANGLED [Trifolium pratense]
MVSKTPPTQNNNMLAVFDPVLIRQTLNKVDQCMNRLQELQFTVSGGTKLVSGVNLSPRSTRTYLRTSLRCKQESIRIKNSAQKTSPLGKFPKPANLGGEWRQMSLPAMLVGETVAEILQASQFTRQIVSVDSAKFSTEEPKTPLSQPSNKKADPENLQLIAKRRKEKQNKQQSDLSPSPPLQGVRSRINFKVSPPVKVRDFDKEKENNKYLANRVSPRNRPWERKTVLFPNPLFSSSTSSSSSSHQQKICKTRSPVISRNRVATTPHKFRIKSPHKFLINSPNRVTPPSPPPKFRIKSPHTFLIKSPNRVTTTTPPKFRTESPHKFINKSPNRVTTPSPPPKFRIKSPHTFLIKSPNRVTTTPPPKFRTESPHKFINKSPNRVTTPSPPPKFRIKSPHTFLIKSPNRVTTTTPPKFRTESPHKFINKSPNRVTTPHKFRIESPHKFLSKSPPSPKRTTRLNSPKRCGAASKRCGAASKSSRPISPSRLTAPTKNKRSVQKSDGLTCLSSPPKSKKSDGLVCLSNSSPKRSAPSKLHGSFSPSRLPTRLVSPLKSKKNVQKVDGLVSGSKQRPATTVQLPGPRFKHIL